MVTIVEYVQGSKISLTRANCTGHKVGKSHYLHETQSQKIAIHIVSKESKEIGHNLFPYLKKKCIYINYGCLKWISKAVTPAHTITEDTKSHLKLCQAWP